MPGTPRARLDADHGPARRPAGTSVIGAGTMGSGIAQVFALGGIDVALFDAHDGVASAARERAIATARAFAERGTLGDDAPELIAAHVRVPKTLQAAVAGADLVLEAVPEDPSVKRATYALVEGAVAAETVIATNTSAIPIAELSGMVARPDRFLGAHWFNPAQWVPCVELIAGPATDPIHLEWLGGLLLSLGKEPTVVGDSAGFVANRIQFAMFREAVAVVEEGVASPEAVDAIVRSSFGFRLPFSGPFQIADLAGLDVYAGAYAALAAAFGQRFAAPRAVTDLVADGRLGVKHGGGFHPAPAPGELASS